MYNGNRMNEEEKSGFSRQIYSGAIKLLNEAYDSLHQRLVNVKRSTLERIAGLVSPVENSGIFIDKENKDWFEKLEFKNGIVILFPWYTEKGYNSINVYKNKKDLTYNFIDGFLEKIAKQMNVYPTEI